MPPSSGTADANPQVQHAKAFSVSIPTLTLEVGLFTQVTGISSQVDVMEYPEGGINTFVHRLPTRIKQGNITLKRGVTKEKALLQWFQSTVVKVQPADLSINVLDELGNTMQSWSFRNAYPVKWTGLGPQCGRQRVHDAVPRDRPLAA